MKTPRRILHKSEILWYRLLGQFELSFHQSQTQPMPQGLPNSRLDIINAITGY